MAAILRATVIALLIHLPILIAQDLKAIIIKIG